MKKTTVEIRQAFLDFFCEKDHKIIQGSSLIPDNDSTLLFTNSGMNQFKNIFLGLSSPVYRRVATAQSCIRAGGKHNDLENVGYTGYHLTFFEMLGNFSFGDYFKEDAIQFAWELLTSSKWFNLPKDKLLITVHKNDEESYNIWHNKIGISKKYIKCVGCDTQINSNNYLCDNFWQMADIGPCGPCSEIFYDFSNHNSEIRDSDIKSEGDSCYIEIWNLVFMQFNRQLDGRLLPLPTLSVDTGMGLERISSILQSVHDNYGIDLFYCLMTDIIQILGKKIDFKNCSLRVIADHIRSCCFLIIDGIKPSNEGRGYILRRIIRRAVQHGKYLNIHEIFFYKLVYAVVKNMSYLNERLTLYRKNIEDILFNEENQFYHIIERGLEVLNKELEKLNNKHILSGETIFYLYSTYGLPIQFIEDCCSSKKITIDKIGFEKNMLLHRECAKKSNKFIPDLNKFLLKARSTNFIGYEYFSCYSDVISLFKDNQSINIMSEGDTGIIVLDQTPFYGESGGQVGDRGTLKCGSSIFEVETTKRYGHIFYHLGKLVHGTLHLKDQVFAQIDQEYRKKVSLNHSATHLLHFALCNVFGDHILQKGSYINDRFLRFDFSHNASISFDQICLIENIVNKQIQNNILVQSEIISFDIALHKKIKFLSSKKYDHMVRVLSIGNISSELCSGTHVVRTGDIGLFSVYHECGISSGIRRIEACSGTEALSYFHKERMFIKSIEHRVKGNRSNVLQKISSIYIHIEQLEKELSKFKNKEIFEKTQFFVKRYRDICNTKLIIDQVSDFDIRMLRIIVNNLKNHLKSRGIVILGSKNHDCTMNLVVGITDDLTAYVNSIDIIKYIIDNIGGRGGGRLDLAQSYGGSVQKFLNIMGKLDVMLIEKFKIF